MKTFYALAWVFLGLIAVRLGLTGALNSVALVVLSFAALGLLYGLALWSVMSNTRDTMPNVFSRTD